MRLEPDSVQRDASGMGIRFEGRSVPARPGETVAAALSAAGILAFRRTASGAERGLWCGMGACFDCIVTIDGRAGQRACMVKARDGMVVGGDARASLGTQQAPAEWRCDVLVVGGGPAGLSAAIAARAAGADVLLIEEREKPGGQYFKPLAVPQAAPPDAQFRAGDALRAEAIAAGVRVQTNAMVWGAFAPDDIAAVVDDRAVTIRPRRLVLATGAHERPVPMPGWTLPGAMTTGALQSLARAQRVSPRERVVIAGSGPLNMQLALELLTGGVQVAAVVEAAPRPGLRAWRDALAMLRAAPDLAWQGLAMLWRLRRAGVPVLWGVQPDSFDGAALRLSDGQRIATELVALNLGFQPETGLARALGAAHRVVDEGLGWIETITDADGRSSIAEVFAVGDGAALGGARLALARGRAAGLAAARDLGFSAAAPDHRAVARAARFQDALWRFFARPRPALDALPDATVICRCEEVTAGALRAAQADGAQGLAALKKATRAGMGRCQGRMCGAVLGRMAGATAEADFAAPRAPLRPVPIVTIARDAEGTAKPLSPMLRPLSPRGGCPADAEVLVIGGGVMGLAIAHALARDGRDVLIAERGEPGEGASTANAGSLHVQLHGFDAVGELDARSPLAALVPLSVQAIALWRTLADDASALRVEGGLMLAQSADEMAWLTRKVVLENQLGLGSTLLDARALRDAAPWLGDGFLGAALCPEEGQMDPLFGLSALLRHARAAGVRIATRLGVDALARDGSGFIAHTNAGAVRAARVVNAAGPYSAVVAAMLGLSLPVRGVVQQVLVTEAAPPMLRPLVLHAGRRLSLKQGALGQMILGGGWPGDWDAARGVARNRRASIEGNLAVALDVMPALDRLHLLRAWAGLNVHLDGAPQIGEDPRCPGLYHAATFNGWTLAPAVAMLIAEQMAGRGAPPIAFRPGG